MSGVGIRSLLFGSDFSSSFWNKYARLDGLLKGEMFERICEFRPFEGIEYR